MADRSSVGFDALSLTMAILFLDLCKVAAYWFIGLTVCFLFSVG